MSWLAGSGWALMAALALDAAFGEPPAAVHPVIWMGRAIRPLTRMAPAAATRELVTGAIYVLAVTGAAAALAWAVERGLQHVEAVRWLLHVYLLVGCFALRALCQAGEALAGALAAGDLPAARHALTSLCSRDPQHLDASELSGAAIESLTENTCDSVVAPLAFYALFGLPGLVFYRAANTLDAMVGYRGRYEYLGKAAARLDDVLNWLPARLTALLLWACGGALGLSWRHGAAVYWRDRARTPSPNAGQSMAMAAGLLGVRLDKRDSYVLGEGLPRPDLAALRAALRLVRVTGLCAAVLCVVALLWWQGRPFGTG